MRNTLIVLFCYLSTLAWGQELNCNVVINATQTGNENLQIFKTLEKQLTEFVNNTKWTNKTFAPQERIDCSMVINISKYNNEFFEATLQVQSTRPVYGTAYSTPVYNFNDKDFGFKYLEYQNLIYNPTQYESNLVSVLAFHVYIILGLDADTFAENGGNPYFDQAQAIVNYSQQENYSGWKLQDGLQSRFALIDNILSPTYKEYRQILYSYHREGMDNMSDNLQKGKQAVSTAIQGFNAINNRRPNAFVVRTFFDAKADEIANIFTDGPSVSITALKQTLLKVAPTYSSKWQKIKY